MSVLHNPAVLSSCSSVQYNVLAPNKTRTVIATCPDNCPFSSATHVGTRAGKHSTYCAACGNTRVCGCDPLAHPRGHGDRAHGVPVSLQHHTRAFLLAANAMLSSQPVCSRATTPHPLVATTPYPLVATTQHPLSTATPAVQARNAQVDTATHTCASAPYSRSSLKTWPHLLHMQQWE